MLLEICVDSLESAAAAIRGGANRLEVCGALSVGGITPSAGLISAIQRQSNIDLSILIRPRAGDFLSTDDEFLTMQQDIRFAKHMGASSVALGILDVDGNIDIQRTQVLVDLARPMKVTIHRAFDMTPDPFIALEQCIACGADRILTSGGAASAEDSLEILSSLCIRAKDRIGIMPGGGIRINNIGRIAQQTQAREFHAGMRTILPSNARYRKAAVFLGKAAENTESYDQEYSRTVVLEKDVRALREQLHEVELRAGENSPEPAERS